MIHRNVGRLFIAVGAVLIAGASRPATLPAQTIVSSLEAQATRIRYADSVNVTAAGLTPSLDAVWKNAAATASGTFAQLSRAWSADGALGLSLFTPSVGPLFGELAGTLGGSAHQDGARTGSAIAMARFHADGNTAGAWLGAGGGTTSDGYAWRQVREGEAGAWLGGGPATLTVTAQPTIVEDSIRYTDFGVDGTWHGNRFDLGIGAVTRAGSHLPSLTRDGSVWGGVKLVAWVLPRVALMASAGTYPVDYTQGFPGGRFASVGIRLALTPRERPLSPFATDRASRTSGITAIQLGTGDGDTHIFRVNAANARTVEVRGDFTDWQTRSLTRGTDGWYSFQTALAPGTYQVDVRVNGGEWGPPPSLPTVRDEFGGMTGVLVVP